MENLIKDLLVVALDPKESDKVRIEAMITAQALRFDKSKAVMSSTESQELIDSAMFDETFEISSQDDNKAQSIAAGSIAAIIYKKTGYDISRYRVKKLLKNRGCKIHGVGTYFVKLINK